MKLNKKQQEALCKIVQDTLWMARRYADGRSTYAPNMFNDSVHLLEAVGLGDLYVADKDKWANDGMFGKYDPEIRQFVRVKEKEDGTL